MKTRIILCLALISSGGWSVLRADLIPGVDRYVANAKVIEVVQAETPAQAQAFPALPESQRVWVKEVLKGVDTKEEFLLPKGTLEPGGTAVVLFQYEPPVYWQPVLQSSRAGQGGILVWPIDAAGKVDTHGVPTQTQGGRLLPTDADGNNLDLIKKDIAIGTPEEVDLNRQVVDALLFPDKFQALAGRDAGRAVYVRFIVTILDLNRDVPLLAQLLESPDPTIRPAALKRLEALTATTIPAPKDENPVSLHGWSVAWAGQQQAMANPSSRWPPVPADLKAPPDTFPEPLIQALLGDDADGFAKAFAPWLDSGVMRDREIQYAATTLNREMVQGSNWGGAIGETRYLPPAPRLRPDVILEASIPATDRMKAIALLAQLLHYDRFARERAEAITSVASVPPDSDILRRAAFWELRDANVKTAGQVALERLAQSGDNESSQRLVLGLCLNYHMDDDALDAARSEIQAKRQTFIDGLFDYVETHRDDKAQWIARLFCQEGQKQVVPVLLDWLKDGDAQVRKSAAFNLCWLPSADAVPKLLDAIHSESDVEVKAQVLVALAQTGDNRGLETLLAAAREPYGLDDADEIVRGLGRIRDPKALATLADIVDGKTPSSKSEDARAYLLPDVVNAFGYISQLYAAHIPDRFQTRSGISDVQVRLKVERVEQWRKSQADK